MTIFLFGPLLRKKILATCLPTLLWNCCNYFNNTFVFIFHYNFGFLINIVGFFSGKEKLNIAQNESVKLVLETDGTQIEDPEYFKTLPNNTTVLLLRDDELWYPAGVDAIKTGYYEAYKLALCFYWCYVYTVKIISNLKL